MPGLQHTRREVRKDRLELVGPSWLDIEKARRQGSFVPSWFKLGLKKICGGFHTALVA
jgi:hypothetical protein